MNYDVVGIVCYVGMLCWWNIAGFRIRTSLVRHSREAGCSHRHMS